MPAAGHLQRLPSTPSGPYIAYNDMPKIADLKATLPALYRQQPVLVAKAEQSN